MGLRAGTLDTGLLWSRQAQLTLLMISVPALFALPSLPPSALIHARTPGDSPFSSFSFSYTAASVIDTASKYKLLWKLPLEDVDIVKGLCCVLA